MNCLIWFLWDYCHKLWQLYLLFLYLHLQDSTYLLFLLPTSKILFISSLSSPGLDFIVESSSKTSFNPYTGTRALHRAIKIIPSNPTFIPDTLYYSMGGSFIGKDIVCRIGLPRWLVLYNVICSKYTLHCFLSSGVGTLLVKIR